MGQYDHYGPAEKLPIMLKDQQEKDHNWVEQMQEKVIGSLLNKKLQQIHEEYAMDQPQVPISDTVEPQMNEIDDRDLMQPGVLEEPLQAKDGARGSADADVDMSKLKEADPDSYAVQRLKYLHNMSQTLMLHPSEDVQKLGQSLYSKSQRDLENGYTKDPETGERVILPGYLTSKAAEKYANEGKLIQDGEVRLPPGQLDTVTDATLAGQGYRVNKGEVSNPKGLVESAATKQEALTAAEVAGSGKQVELHSDSGPAIAKLSDTLKPEYDPSKKWERTSDGKLTFNGIPAMPGARTDLAQIADGVSRAQDGVQASQASIASAARALEKFTPGSYINPLAQSARALLQTAEQAGWIDPEKNKTVKEAFDQIAGKETYDKAIATLQASLIPSGQKSFAALNFTGDMVPESYKSKEGTQILLNNIAGNLQKTQDFNEFIQKYKTENKGLYDPVTNEDIVTAWKKVVKPDMYNWGYSKKLPTDRSEIKDGYVYRAENGAYLRRNPVSGVVENLDGKTIK